MSHIDLFDGHFDGQQDHADGHNQQVNHYDYTGHELQHAVSVLGDDTHVLASVDNLGMVHTSVVEDSVGNVDIIMDFADPLAHAHDYHCNPFVMHGAGHTQVCHAHVAHAPEAELTHVNGYVRQDGTVVRDYVRTMPDGIEENNLSYHR